MNYQYYVQTKDSLGWIDRYTTTNIENAFEVCRQLEELNVPAQVVVREEEVAS